MGSKPLIAFVAIVVAVVLFVVLRGSDEDSNVASSPAPSEQSTQTTEVTDDDAGDGGEKDQPKPPAEPEVATILVAQGQPVGGVAELTFDKGDAIRVIVKSDVAEEIHLHGYDVSQEIEAGGRVEFDVPATIEGVFELELENTAVPLAEISVVPG